MGLNVLLPTRKKMRGSVDLLLQLNNKMEKTVEVFQMELLPVSRLLTKTTPTLIKIFLKGFV